MLPVTTSLGSLVRYASDPATVGYQPMHVNFGLYPPLEGAPRRKAERHAALVRRAREDLDAYLAARPGLVVAAGERRG